MLTNGAQYPKHITPKDWVRLRLLNGCNARSLRLATSDERPMYVIASDGGFLNEPIKVNELEMIIGERFEVLIDLSDGKAVDLVRSNGHGITSVQSKTTGIKSRNYVTKRTR
ncbi:hypothetical protein [Rodentibacter caecimuris]|nr:hypothetical protein [Rodentibacter heylii]MCQ9122875.1 hypothetical protein [Rodentibacter heylii]